MIQGVVEKIQQKYFKNDSERMTNFYANWERSKVAKSDIFKMLGGEEVSVQIEITPDVVAETFSNAFQIVRGMVTAIDPAIALTNEQIVTNRMPSGQKVSRFIIKNKDKSLYRSYLPSRYLRNELGYEGYGIDSFIRTFYEKIAATKAEEIVISANYIDILSAGYVSGENSCYALSIFRDSVFHHGQYSIAPHIFAEDRNTMIAYVLNTDKTKYAKRVWVHVNDERDRFVIGRRYGNWGSHTMTALYRKMEQLLSDDNPSNWIFRTDISGYLSRGQNCVDYDHDFDNMFYTGDTATYSFKKREATTKRLRMSTPVTINCIICGVEHDHVDGSGMCWDCAEDVCYGQRCSVCGERNHNLNTHNGVAFCARCAPAIEGVSTVCPECHQSYSEVGQRDHESGRYVCPACFETIDARRRTQREAFECELDQIRQRISAQRDARTSTFREALSEVYNMEVEDHEPGHVTYTVTYVPNMCATFMGHPVNIEARDLDGVTPDMLRTV